jgi:transposase
MKKYTPKYKTHFRLSIKERRGLDKTLHSTSDASVYRRAEAILALDAGESPIDVANRFRVSRQALYKWFNKFHQRPEESFEVRLSDKKSPGRPKRISGVIDSWILEVIDTDPRKFNYSATTWTAKLLAQYVRDTHGLSISYRSARRALDRLGFRWKRPRYTLSRRPSNWRRKKGALNMGFSAIPV